MEILDFSKGYFDYKEHWSTQRYDFEYHIYYNLSSFRSVWMAHGVKAYYRLKQALRDRRIDEKLNAYSYRLIRPLHAGSDPPLIYSLQEVSPDVVPGPSISKGSVIHKKLNNVVNEHLYLKKKNT